jgi:DNA-binding PadR family transcriptional regulator
MPAKRRVALTTPDLVLLSLLAERRMHGYQANRELERREIRDWAGISRPQVYYSLEKLARTGMIQASETDAPAAGPERSTFATTAKGRAALAQALEREEWTTQRDRPPFLTWIALSWQARPGVFEKQIKRRREFLEKGMKREKEVLASILEEVGHPYHEAVWMVSLVIEQFKLELRWLRKLKRELPQRAQAKHPAYAGQRGSW